MKELIFNLKTELKSLAQAIKNSKQTRKTCPNGYVPNLAKFQFEYRTKHIFRCMLRGKTLDQIENSRLVKEPVPNSVTEMMLHITLSHLHNIYAKTRYNHKIQCNCSKCRDIYRNGFEFKDGGNHDEKVVCANSI